MAGGLQGATKKQLNRFRQTYTGFKNSLDGIQLNLFGSCVFLLKLIVLSTPLYLILWAGWELAFLRTFTASLSASGLQLIGLQASTTGHIVSSGGLLLDVTWDSTGWKSMLVVAALVLASPRSWRSRLSGVAAAVIGVFVLNVTRVISMIYGVTVLGLEYEFLHAFLWRWGLTAAVLVIWGLWLHISRMEESRRLL